MAERNRVSTREWLDPPGPLRRYRRLVGGLVALTILATVLLGLTGAGQTASFAAGMVAIAALVVSYLVIWAADLVVVFTDPDGFSWE